MRLTVSAFVAGCWCLQQQASLPQGRAAGATTIAAMVAVPLLFWLGVSLRDSWPRSMRVVHGLACAALALLCGFAWAAWRAEARLADQLPAALEGQDIEATGVIASLPVAAAQGQRFIFAVETVHRAGESGHDAQLPRAWVLGWYEPPPVLLPGERHRLTVRLRRPHGLANPHGFDYEYRLLQQGVGATGYVRATAGAPVDAVGERIAWRVARWRARVRERLYAAMPQPESASPSSASPPSSPPSRYAPVLVALVVGDQHGIAREDWRLFTRTGIGHLVSISGLHITMISGLAGGIVRGLWRHSFGLGRRLRKPLPLWWPAQRVALAAAVLSGFAYGLIAGMEVPAQRTVAMLVVAALALWCHRTVPASVVLAWAAFVAVALDPWAVLSAGFWLSFGAVAAIFFAARRVDRTRGAGKGGAKQRRWPRLRKTLLDAARTQWAVTIGLVPLTLLLFQQISVVSPLANAVAIPVVSLLVTPAVLLAAASPAPLAGVLLWAAQAVLAWLFAGLEWLAAPQWAVWQAARPGPVTFCLAILGTLWLLSPRIARAGGRATGLLLVLPMLAATRKPLPAGEFRATALDVGQGTAVVVETRSHVLLFDAGPAYGVVTKGTVTEPGSSAGERVIVPFLRGEGIRRLDALVVSHEDMDHAGGARDVAAAVPIAQLVSAVPPGHPLLALPSQRPPPRQRACEAGDTWVWDGVRFEMLHPLPGEAFDVAIPSNARSCVLRISTMASSLLLTGDIERANEQALLARLPAGGLRADVLVVPHHGSGTSSGPGFLAAVQPRDAIFQLGYLNRYHHPRADVWARYGRLGIARYRTDETGAVTVTTHGAAYDIVAFRQHVRRYWRAAPSLRSQASEDGVMRSGD